MVRLASHTAIQTNFDHWAARDASLDYLDLKETGCDSR
jgi:hypothetical protein